MIRTCDDMINAIMALSEYDGFGPLASWKHGNERCVHVMTCYIEVWPCRSKLASGRRHHGNVGKNDVNMCCHDTSKYGLDGIRWLQAAGSMEDMGKDKEKSMGSGRWDQHLGAPALQVSGRLMFRYAQPFQFGIRLSRPLDIA